MNTLKMAIAMALLPKFPSINPFQPLSTVVLVGGDLGLEISQSTKEI